MFIGHHMLDENTIVLVLDPLETEFSSELGTINNIRKTQIKDQAHQYIEGLPKVHPKIVKIMLGTIVVATFALNGGGIGGVQAAAVQDNVAASTMKSYTVKPGDTLYSIARANNLTVEQLKQMNQLSSNIIYVGQNLALSSNLSQSPTVSTSSHHVQAGDTLYAIANKYNMTVDELMKLNGLTSNTIMIGQSLKVSAISQAAPTSYTVKAGDTLYNIANRFNISVDNLKEWNNLSSNNIQIGQQLTTAPTQGLNEQAPKNNEDIRQTLVKDTFSYIGVPYVWGGTTPNGFDCSGFVSFMFNKHGVNIPRVTSGDYYKMGAPVSVANLQPGDLVFYAVNTPGQISHVGFYVGNNEFISATSSKGIAVYSLDNSYWSKYYVGAKRVF